MRGTLPGNVIDLIHAGADGADRRAQGDRAVYGALRRACTAVQRGWMYSEWTEGVKGPRRGLGRHVQLRNSILRGRACAFTIGTIVPTNSRGGAR